MTTEYLILLIAVVAAALFGGNILMDKLGEASQQVPDVVAPNAPNP